MTGADDGRAEPAEAPAADEAAPHISRSFDRGLERLRAMALELGARAAERLTEAPGPEQEPSGGESRRFAEGDRALNRLCRDISDGVVEAIATRQPMADDLRLLLALLRSARDLERVGDCSSGLAAIAARMEAPPPPAVSEALSGLAREARAFLELVLADLRDGSSLALGRGAALDDEIDARHRALARLVVEEAAAGRLPLEDAMRLASASRLIERAGDHIAHVSDAFSWARDGRWPARR